MSRTTIHDWMSVAIDLAQRGLGFVEPNPLVGAVVLDAQGDLVATGWHERYGGPHAEAVALQHAGDRARGGTLIVTLEPCAHYGKTPPCADAVITAGVNQVVIGALDPAPHTSRKGLQRLSAAGVSVIQGVLGAEANELIAPFRTLQLERRPWVHAKWAMTLDGKLATKTGHSQWISCEASRQRVHQLRSRMDAVIVGIGTALSDDPLLTARLDEFGSKPARVAARVVLDRQARLPIESQLVRTIDAAPVWLATTALADKSRLRALADRGVDILLLPDATDQTGAASESMVSALLRELAARGAAHVLVEGGAGALGAFHDANCIDEVHAFISPKLVGGAAAPGPIGGCGLEQIPAASSLRNVAVIASGPDICLNGRVGRHGLPSDNLSTS